MAAELRDVAQRQGQRAALVEAEHLREALELQARVAEVLAVGVREVRVDALDVDVRRAGGGIEQALGVVVVDADPLHPRVDLEVHGRLPARGGRGLLHVTQAGEGRDGQRQPVLEEERDLARPGPAGHQDRLLDPEAPQHDAFLDERHPDGVRLWGEAARDGLEAVAVGVGLEHGHDAGGRHVRPDRGQVLAQARETHDGIRRAEACLLGIDHRDGVHAPGLGGSRRASRWATRVHGNSARSQRPQSGASVAFRNQSARIPLIAATT